MDGFDSEKATEAAAAAGYADDTIENCVVAVDASGAELGYVISVTDRIVMVEMLPYPSVLQTMAH